MEFFKKHRLLALLAASTLVLLFAYGISNLVESDDYSARKLYADPARQVNEDITQALSRTYQIQSFGEWLNTGFTPDEIFKNAKDLKASETLCNALERLNTHDLTFFDSVLRNEQSSRFIHCRSRLLSKLNRAWKEDVQELDDYVQDHFSKDTKLSKFSLCFHGGPDPTRTSALLDLLKKTKTKVSFYVHPAKARLYPRLVKRMIKEGHQVGAMGWGDVTLGENIHRDILRTQEMIVTLGMQPNGSLSAHPEHLESHDWKYRNPTELFQSIQQTLEQNAASSDRFPLSLSFSDQFEQSLIVVAKLLEVGQPVSIPKSLDRNSKQKMAQRVFWFRSKKL